MLVTQPWRAVALALGIGLVIVAFLGATLMSPTLAGAVSVGVLLTGAAAYFIESLRRWFFTLLVVALLGYVTMGRGFAYFGFPPVYVGELLLAFGLVVLLLRGDLWGLLRTPAVVALVAFMLVGAAATLPYLPTYGLDALRDGVTWGYAVFALVVGGAIVDREMVHQAMRWYVRLLPVLLAGPVVGFALLVVTRGQLPLVPFSQEPIINHKGGDVAVHLAGVLAFLLLGLHHRYLNRPREDVTRREWLWWGLWIAAWITTLTVRAGYVTLAAVAGLVLLLRPSGRWWRLAVLVVGLVAVSLAFDIEVTIGREGRPISAERIVTMLSSVVNPVEEGDFSGTRRWRLSWWSEIVDYTVFGPYFWTGKGYGVNLADEDGYQVWVDPDARTPLRSPHNVHMTILGRSGVPGAVTWVVFNVVLVGSLLVAFVRRRAEGRHDWAALDLWLIAYWGAIIVNASFDVYLEGPPGGVWFWTLVGFAFAVLRLQPRGVREDANDAASSDGPTPATDGAGPRG